MSDHLKEELYYNFITLKTFRRKLQLPKSLSKIVRQ